MKIAPGRLRFTRLPFEIALCTVLTLLVFILHPSALILSAQPACYTLEQAAAHVGETACVEGLVTNALWAAQSNGRPTFLDFGTSFTVVIWQEDRAKFNPPPETLRGHRLRVQGRIETFRNKPQIIVRNPSQLTVVGAALPAATATSVRTPVQTAAATAPPSPSPAPSEPAPVTAAPTVAPPPVSPATTPASTAFAAIQTPEPPPTATDPVPRAETGGATRWPLVFSGLGLVGAGVAGVVWYGLRHRE